MKKNVLILLFTTLLFSCISDNNKITSVETSNNIQNQESYNVEESTGGDVPCNEGSHFTNITFEDSGQWQFISASQSYNTMYGIYIQFEYNEKTNNINRLKLNLRNYKTNIPIGIFDVVVDYSKSTPIINVYVQALDNIRTTEWINVDIPYNKEEFLKINRILMPMFIVPEDLNTVLTNTGESSNKYFVKTFNYKNPNNNSRELIEKKWYATSSLRNETKVELLKSIDENRGNSVVKNNLRDLVNNYSTLFDNEFFFKDGEDYIIPKYDYEDIVDDTINPSLIFLAGCRCKTSKVKIL